VLPLKDNVPTRHFPILTVGLIVANIAMWLLYQDAGSGRGFEASINELAYHPCEVEDSCRTVGEDWPVTAITSMFMHGSWDHLLGNMLFLWIFGNNIEDTVGRFRFLGFYLLAGLAATALQTFVTLEYATNAEAQIPNLGASGAISGLLGAYILLYPGGKVLTLILPIFFFELPAFLYLGIWFLFQLWDGGLSLVHPQAGGGVAYFAHIGGFVFGLLAIKLFSLGRPRKLQPSY
jgi:membrane associated rhomboid family serine protease